MATSPPTPAFFCSLNSTDSPKKGRLFQQEVNKKASFVLDVAEDDEFSAQKPAHLFVQASVDSDSPELPLPFLLGGFELVSNSRNIEVYVLNEAEDDDEQQPKEEYITTCRGIRSCAEDDLWYQVVHVIPGGPRSILRLKLKMLSLRPAKSTKSRLKSIKLKGRLPQVEATSVEHVRKEATTSTTATPGLSKNDVTSALAGVSMMVRSTEERLTTLVQTGLTQLSQGTKLGIQGLEQGSGNQLAAIQQLQTTVSLQQEMLIQQKEIMQSMQQQQLILLERFETLSAEMRSRGVENENAQVPVEPPPVAVIVDDDKPQSRPRDQEEKKEVEELVLLEPPDKAAEVMATSFDSETANHSVPSCRTISDHAQLLARGVVRVKLPEDIDWTTWATTLSTLTPAILTAEGDGEYAFYRNILEEPDFPFQCILAEESDIRNALIKHFPVTNVESELRLDDAFCVHYNMSQEDTSGAKHMDPSDITVNMCLEKSPDVEYSQVVFYGSQRLESVDAYREKKESFIVDQVPGYATLHYGHHTHETTAMAGGGRRTNIVITYCYADPARSGAAMRTCYS